MTQKAILAPMTVREAIAALMLMALSDPFAPDDLVEEVKEMWRDETGEDWDATHGQNKEPEELS